MPSPSPPPVLVLKVSNKNWFKLHNVSLNDRWHLKMRRKRHIVLKDEIFCEIFADKGFLHRRPKKLNTTTNSAVHDVWEVNRGQVQTPYFTWAESNANEKNPLFSLISIRFGSCEVRRLNLALETTIIRRRQDTWDRLQAEVSSKRVKAADGMSGARKNLLRMKSSSRD